MICGYHLLYFKYEIFHRAGAALINQPCVGNRGSFDQINGLMGFLFKRIVIVCRDGDQLSYKTRLILSFCNSAMLIFSISVSRLLCFIRSLISPQMNILQVLEYQGRHLDVSVMSC